jgi:hypothetical protein
MSLNAIAIPAARGPGCGNDSYAIGLLAGIGFLGSHSNAKKQLSHHNHRGILQARRFRGNRETIAHFRR